MNPDDLFEFANDSNGCMLCDWREEPDAVIEYANGFLPDDLQMEYTDDDDGLSFSNCNGRYATSFDDYETVEEAIPGLVREINKLIAPSHEARYFNCMDGTDGYSYLVRPVEFWRSFDARHPEDSHRIFREP